MESGTRRIGPNGVKIHRVEVDSSAASIQVLASVANKRFCLVAASLSADAAGSIDFESATTPMMGNTFKTADPAWVLPYNPEGWCETDFGEDFHIDNAGTLALDGVLVIWELG